MEEANPSPMGSRTRDFIDQLATVHRGEGESARYIIRPIGHMVQRFSSVVEELANRGVCACRSQQLDPTLANGKHRDFYSLRVQAFTTTHPQPKPSLVNIDRSVQIFDSDAYVIDPAQHGLILGPP